jgi:hypothetical protein
MQRKVKKLEESIWQMFAASACATNKTATGERPGRPQSYFAAKA